jgi:L-2-hydroxycarboxylate dehydrogenase (NAD+)
MLEHEPVIDASLTPDNDPLWTHAPNCEGCNCCDAEILVNQEDLEEFVVGVMRTYGVPAREGRIVAKVLVSSDLRGIPSHGVARLGRYLAGIEKGFIVPGVEPEVHEPAPAIAVVDAKNGLGQVASELAMELAITKAKANGLGMVTVKNSNHYGIAGYYALKALDQRMIGIAMTNAAPLVVPTFGREVMFGTNPIAFAAPAKGHPGFVLDTATSVVPRGKLEVYDRNRTQMPVGWAIDHDGYDALNPGLVLRNLLERAGGGILPLGGRGELYSGYKGYGLAVMVDVLCGVLSGAAYGPFVYDMKRTEQKTGKAAPNVGHFFLAVDIERFMPIPEFEARMAEYIQTIRKSAKALDQERIWIHGEKEFEKAECAATCGIPLAGNVYGNLVKIAEQCGHPKPVTRECENC